MTLSELRAALDAMDDGVLKSGTHKAGGREFCALEFESQIRKRPWSDAPTTLPDLRALNDAGWSSDQARTDALLPVMVALWDWAIWAPKRRQAWGNRVAFLTVNRIVSELPTLPDDIRARCRSATTVEEAGDAAAAAAAWAEKAAAAWARAAAAAAAEAAWAGAAAAAEAAAAAAAAWAEAEAAAAAEAAGAAADHVLKTACEIWIEAVA